jgi:PAS domain S-box-containing protein
MIRRAIMALKEQTSEKADAAAAQAKASPALADTVTPDTLNLRTRDKDRETAIQSIQVEQAIRNLPLFIIFHAAAAFSLYTIATYPEASILLPLWYVAAVVVGLYCIFAFMMWRKPKWQQRPQAMLRGLEFLCLLLAIVWALPLAAAAQLQSPTNTVGVACITLGVMGITAMTLIRIPAGLVVFLSLVSTTLAGALFKSLDNQQGLAVGLCALYCLVLLSIILTSHIDFRRRTHAELDVTRQKDVIRLLLNDFERGTPDWLWEADKEGHLSYVSPRLTELLGVATEYPLGKRLRHVLEGCAPHEELRKLDLSLDAAETVRDFAMTARINRETFQWRFSSQPILDVDGKIIGHRGVCRDVTASMEDHQRIEKAVDATEQANAVKSQFLAIMSHELRTPINAIVGFSELLAKNTSESLPIKQRKEYAEIVLENSKQLHRLINDVLDTARLERGTLTLSAQEIDAAEVVELAIGQSRAQAEHANISIIAKLADNITLSVDVARLQQAIANVIANAVKFSQAGGIVNIEMQRGKNGAFILAVKDAGIGIAEDDFERVFDPFVQGYGGLARNYNGAGLGLPIARRIVRMHDGDITLQSTLGAGTIVNLTLPKHRVHWPMKKPQAMRDVA